MSKLTILFIFVIMFVVMIGAEAERGYYRIKYDPSQATTVQVRSWVSTNCGGNTLTVEYFQKVDGYVIISTASRAAYAELVAIMATRLIACPSTTFFNVNSSDSGELPLSCLTCDADPLCLCNADVCNSNDDCTSAQYCSNEKLCAPRQILSLSISYSTTLFSIVNQQFTDTACGTALTKIYHLTDTKVVTFTFLGIPGDDVATSKAAILAAHPACFSSSDYTWQAIPTGCETTCGAQDCLCDAPRKVFFTTALSPQNLMTDCSTNQNIVISYTTGAGRVYGTFKTLATSPDEMKAVLPQLCAVTAIDYSTQECQQTTCGASEECGCPLDTPCSQTIFCSTGSECLDVDEDPLTDPDFKCRLPPVAPQPVPRTLKLLFSSPLLMTQFAVSTTNSALCGLKAHPVVPVYSLLNSNIVYATFTTDKTTLNTVLGDLQTSSPFCYNILTSTSSVTLVKTGSACEIQCGSADCLCELSNPCQTPADCSPATPVCHKTLKVCSLPIGFSLPVSISNQPLECVGEATLVYTLPLQKKTQFILTAPSSDIYSTPKYLSSDCLAALALGPSNFTLTTTRSCMIQPGSIDCFAEVGQTCTTGATTIGSGNKICLPVATFCNNGVCAFHPQQQPPPIYTYTVLFLNSRFPSTAAYAQLPFIVTRDLSDPFAPTNPCVSYPTTTSTTGVAIFSEYVFQNDATSTVAFKIKSPYPFAQAIGSITLLAPKCLLAFSTQTIIEGSMFDMTCSTKCGYQATTGTLQPCLCAPLSDCTNNQDCLNSLESGQQLECVSGKCAFRTSNVRTTPRFLAIQLPSQVTNEQAERLFQGLPATAPAQAMEYLSHSVPISTASITSTIQTHLAFQQFGELATEIINGPCSSSSGKPILTLNYISSQGESRVAYTTIQSQVATVQDMKTVNEIPNSCFSAFGSSSSFTALSTADPDLWTCRNSCGTPKCLCQLNQPCSFQAQCALGFFCLPSTTGPTSKSCQTYTPPDTSNLPSTQPQLARIYLSGGNALISDYIEQFKKSLGQCFKYQITFSTSPSGHSGVLVGVTTQQLLQLPLCQRSSLELMKFGSDISVSRVEFEVDYDFDQCAVVNPMTQSITHLTCGGICKSVPCDVMASCVSSSDCVYGSCVSNSDGNSKYCNSALQINLLFVFALLGISIPFLF